MSRAKAVPKVTHSRQGNSKRGLEVVAFVVAKARSSVPRTVAPRTVAPRHDNFVQVADQQRYLDFFWSCYLPGGVTNAEEAYQYSHLSWIDAARGFSDWAPVRLAILANCLCMLATQHGEDFMMVEGSRVYGRALRQMQRELCHFDESRRDALLVAARLLGLFVVFFETTREDRLAQVRTWASLLDAEKRFLFSAQPHQYSVGLAHRSFSNARAYLVTPNLLSNTRSTFHDPVWMTIPWLEQSRTLLDTMVDLSLRASELLQALSRRRNSTPAEGTLSDLESRCREVVAELESWHDRIVPVLAAHDPKGNSTLSTVDLAKTHLLLLFWSVSLLVSAAITNSMPTVQLPLGFWVHNLRQNILKCLRRCFKREAGWFGANIAACPLGVVLKTLDASPVSQRERQLLTRFLEDRKMRGVKPLLVNVREYFLAS